MSGKLTNLIKLRKSKGITQEEMGKKLNVSRVSYSRWESGESKPSLDDLVFLADFFGVSLDYLVGRQSAVLSDPTDRKAVEDAIETLSKCVGKGAK
jgi:transcriptional regulator with XRE-family HTH domain